MLNRFYYSQNNAGIIYTSLSLTPHPHPLTPPLSSPYPLSPPHPYPLMSPPSSPYPLCPPPLTPLLQDYISHCGDWSSPPPPLKALCPIYTEKSSGAWTVSIVNSIRLMPRSRDVFPCIFIIQ